MKNILSQIELDKEKILKLLINIASIPSPTGNEQNKIQFIKEKLTLFGIKDISIDSIGNCIAKLPATLKARKRKTILIVAHADTACDTGKKVIIKEDNKYIYGHGVCDNSAGITGLLTTISFIKKHKIIFSNNLIIGFTVGEEGLGAKRGMKKIIKDYGGQIDAVINVESHPLGRITNQVIGQYRCQLFIDTKQGGHSFRNFGIPNANVILAQIISDFSQFKLTTTKEKTTFNVGQMKGEGSINAIPRISSCLFEIRSENNKSLNKAIKFFESVVDKYRKRFPNIEIKINISAEVPAVIFPATHKLYKLVMKVHQKLEIKSNVNAGNTDGDVSLAKGIPTVTIGTTYGWNTHSLNEYVDKQSLSLGIKQVFTVIQTMATKF